MKPKINSDSEPLEVYTARYAYAGDDRLDISRKGADPLGLLFAPSWEVLRPMLELRRAKKGEAAEDAEWPRYRRGYVLEMRRSFVQHRPQWDELLSRPRVTLVCFCVNEHRCHRSVLAGDILPTLGAVYQGEREPGESLAKTWGADVHRCMARGCERPVPAARLMCSHHWHMVPGPIGKVIWAEYYAHQHVGRPPSQAWTDAVKKAIRAVQEKEAPASRELPFELGPLQHTTKAWGGR